MLSPQDHAAIQRLARLTRRRVNGPLAGAYRSTFRGQGMEFEEVRPYVAGDEVRRIDWNVTARAEEPYVKLFREERELSVWVAADLSASTFFGTQDHTKHSLIAHAAAVLIFAATGNRDRAGLVTFTDRVEGFVKPGRGQRHATRLVRDVWTARPEGRSTRLAVACDRVAAAAAHRAVVAVVSDFLDLDEADDAALRRLARRHDVVPVVIEDPREAELPRSGLLRVIDPETGTTRMLDTASGRVRRAYAQRAAEAVTRRDQRLRAVGLRPLGLRTDQDPLPLIQRYFERRSR